MFTDAVNRAEIIDMYNTVQIIVQFMNFILHIMVTLFKIYITLKKFNIWHVFIKNVM